LIDEAVRQLNATRSTGSAIEWRVVDEEMALRIGSILDDAIQSQADRSRIAVIFTPLSDVTP
jgi:hypothetical protein